MKNVFLNFLSFISICFFFLLITATSVEGDFCYLNIEMTRTPLGFEVKNQDDFNYNDLQLIITKTLIDSSQLPKIVPYTNMNYELNGGLLEINVKKEFLLADFKSNSGAIPSNDLTEFRIQILASSPKNGLCGFDKSF